MFGPFGGFEILVLAAIGLLVFGPRRLPEIGRSLGKVILEFRKAATELRTSIEREINLEEMKETTRSILEEPVAALKREVDLEGLKEATRSVKKDLEEGVAPGKPKGTRNDTPVE